MVGRITVSVWLRIACLLISLPFLYLSSRALRTGAPLVVEASRPAIGGHAVFRLDRSVVVFPGDCATISWETLGAREVIYNYLPAEFVDAETTCITPWMIPSDFTLKVIYLNGEQQTLTMTPVILSLELRTWLYPFLTVLALLGAIQPWRRFPAGKRAMVSGLIVLCILLSAITVSIQISDKTFDFTMRRQADLHTHLLQGTPEFTQWQYRILSDYIAEVAIRAGDLIGVGVPAVFTLMRLAQNALLFMLAAYYFYLVGGTIQVVLIGLALSSWSIANSNYNLALVFDTFGDVIFYLMAAILIARQKFIWVIPVAFLASLNRETSGLIPVLLIASQIRFRPLRLERRVILIGAAAVAVWAAGQMLPRAIYGWRPGEGNYDHVIGIDLIGFNLGREISWRMLFSTLNLVPLLALLQLPRTSPLLKRFFWTMIPIWVIIHFASGIVAESRLFLVPMIVVLVPIVLTGISQVSTAVPVVNGMSGYAESEQTGTLPRALPADEVGLSTGT